MRWMFQLCLLLLVLLSAETRAWGRAHAGQNIASGGPPLILVDCADPDAPPTLITQGEPGPCGYEPAPDVRDGPNLYAYVRQNPWTSWDPLGLWGYDDTLRWGAEQYENGNTVGAMGAAVLASAWNFFSFGSAAKNDTAALNYLGGDISGKQLAGEMTTNTLTSTAKAVVVYGTGGLAAAGTSVPVAAGFGAGVGATMGGLEVANNRVNAAIENRAYEGTVGSDVRDIAVSTGFGAATAGVFQLGANTFRAGMEGYAQASLPKYNGSQTEGAMVTSKLDFVRLQSGGANPQYSNYPAASHVEGKAALFMRDGGATSGTVFHNNPGGTCPMCNSNIPTLLQQGSTLTTVPPAGAIATKRGFNAREKTYTGNSAEPKPRD